MLEAKGAYNSAKIFTNSIDSTAMDQIVELCNQSFVEGSTIRIMPDTHAGAGCTIGTTMTIQDKVVPNLVGVDIGCGLEVAIVDKQKDEVNFDQLDDVIRTKVPHGFNVRSQQNRHPYGEQIDFPSIRAPFNENRALNSVGTLGGGNHFIELNEYGNKIALVIHSGSRNLGKQIAEHYQGRAYDGLMTQRQERDALIDQLKQENRNNEIQAALSAYKRPTIKRDLAYLEGEGFIDYMHDMGIAQQYARLNRKAMVDEIIKGMGWTISNSFTTIHNYIDLEQKILRKGAISAQKGERVIIPLNMRDGSILATGKGNKEWNYSGPHGAGRLMSRRKAKDTFNLGEFKDAMAGIWTTSLSEETIDEAPMVYKPMKDILEQIQDSVEVQHIIKPLYNFKAK
ncbi:RtcB family protein [Shouchella hunanensis]|uniref:3'-phosphate/5'-hydroxy nucleic acid ligase n=1 Tax=Shouchella hunanensis TaxID=766894 RepID=A0ABY7W781_9BACI|nr:RtcB family protein [Shouchella hunanensis]WDF04802.1 RtcB family protein [Shouchella hunanensis]